MPGGFGLATCQMIRNGSFRAGGAQIIPGDVIRYCTDKKD